MKRPLDILIALIMATSAMAQDSSAKKTLLLTPVHTTVNNKVQYAGVTAKTKIEKKFQNVPGLTVSFYLDGSDAKNLIGKAVTNEKGVAMLPIPPSVQEAYNAAASHTLTASVACCRA